MTHKTLLNTIGVALYTMAACAQNPPTALRISAPANNLVAHPGDYVAVTVVPAPSPGAPAIQQVMLSAEGMGYTNLQRAPFQFGVRIPSTVTPGPHVLRAMGVAAGSKGIDAVSDAITLNVERLDRPVRMVVEPAATTITIYPGMSLTEAPQRLQAYFEYADGARAPVPAGPGSHLQFHVSGGSVSADAFGLLTPHSLGAGQVMVECVACPGVTGPSAVNVWVAAQSIQVGTESIQAKASGGGFNVDVITNGLSYRVDGETWVRGVTTLSIDHNHWSTSVTVDPNPSAQARVGTLRFAQASGAAQDVVVYQAGKP